MRLKIASILLLAGTVVGCASNPPPPPPMAAMPDPMPAPAQAETQSQAPAMSQRGRSSYKGMAEVTGGRSCHSMSRAQTATVRNNMISLGGMRGRIGNDGTVTPVGRNGLRGTVNGGSADLMATKGRCSYHYNLSQG